MNDDPHPLKLLHPESALVLDKLAAFERLSTETITASLLPSQEHGLKARPDGTILDGNNRIHVLRQRGVDVDAPPREIVARNCNVDEALLDFWTMAGEAGNRGSPAGG